MKKVFLGMPVYGGYDPSFVSSLMHLLGKRPCPMVVRPCVGDSLVARARNRLAAQFLASQGFTQVANVRLGPLANNGGPTRTFLPMPGSPAIDFVITGCPPPSTDQRGALLVRPRVVVRSELEVQLSLAVLAGHLRGSPRNVSVGRKRYAVSQGTHSPGSPA